MLLEEALAQPDVRRGDFQQFVVGQEFQCLFKTHAHRWREQQRVVLAGGAHVGQLLGLERIDDQVVGPAVQPDDLSLVDFLAGADEQLAAILQREQRVGIRRALVHADQGAVLARGDTIGGRAPVIEDAEEQPGARGHGAVDTLEADQAAGRRHVVQPNTATTVGLHVLQLCLALAHGLHHRALVLLVQVQHHLLPRLHDLAVDFALAHPGPRDRQLVAFSPHGLDQHRKVKLAAARDVELVRVLGIVDLQRDVVAGLLEQSRANLATGQELAVVAGERRIVDLEGHVDGRLVDRQRRQPFDFRRIAQRLGNADVGDTGNADDVAGLGRFHFIAVQALEAQHLHHLAAALLALAVDDGDRLARLDPAAVDPADADQADVAGVVEAGDLHLERARRIHIRRRHVLDQRLEQRVEVALGHVRRQPGVAVERRCEDDREFQLLVGRAQLVEQVEGLVDHPVRTRARTVDLVDHDDRPEAHRESLLGDESRLRHRAVDGVDQQQHRIDHGQHALHLAAEVGVARGIDDVDAVIVPGDRGVLRQDGDPALALLVIGIHHPLGQLLVRGELAGLAQELVDQRGLAMIDMGDDGDVSELHVGRDLDCRRGSRPL